MSDKAREFWIKGVVADEFKVVNSIHVIQKWAYYELKDRADKLVEALELSGTQNKRMGYPTGPEWDELIKKQKQAIKDYRGGEK